MAVVTDAGEHADTSDRALVARIGDGDRAALAALYERHAGWLMVRLARRCGDPDYVDSAIQDTFLAVWRQAGDYRPTGEVAAWIWTIALRRLIDQMRRLRPPEPVEEVSRLARVVTEEVPIALADTDLGQAFARLEPDLQAVLAATALDGLTNREAAVLLDIPTGTVKSRLARARRILEEELR